MVLRHRLFAVSATVLFLSAVAAAALPTRDAPKNAPAADRPSVHLDPSGGVNFATTFSHAFRKTARAVQPSVVMIKNTPAVATRSQDRAPSRQQPNWDEHFKGTPFEELFKSDPRFRPFLQRPSALPRRGRGGMGSGVIIDASGIILTNHHVVAGEGKVTVRLHDGREFKAVDIRHDPKTDLAIVRIENAEGLVAARLGDSDRAEIGDWVLALGQPFGLEGTVTAGIISAKSRGLGITDREDFLQTDAAINPGNSGGPLVNLEGEVIGINTAISSISGGNQGVGFAVPVNLARWVSGQLIAEGDVRRAYLGVAIQPVTHALAEQFGATAGHGVLVANVRPESPAAKAGLKPGDVIVKFAEVEVDTPRRLQAIVERCKPGEQQALVVLRDGKTITLTATCRELSDRDGEARTSSQTDSPQFDALGLQVDELTDDVAERLDMQDAEGLVITDVQSGSPADRAGLGRGMIISEVNRRAVTSVAELHKALQDASPGKGTLLLVRSPQGSRFVVIRPQP